MSYSVIDGLVYYVAAILYYTVSRKDPLCLRSYLCQVSTDFLNFWQTYTIGNLQKEGI